MCLYFFLGLGIYTLINAIIDTITYEQLKQLINGTIKDVSHFGFGSVNRIWNVLTLYYTKCDDFDDKKADNKHLTTDSMLNQAMLDSQLKSSQKEMLKQIITNGTVTNDSVDINKLIPKLFYHDQKAMSIVRNWFYSIVFVDFEIGLLLLTIGVGCLIYLSIHGFTRDFYNLSFLAISMAMSFIILWRLCRSQKIGSNINLLNNDLDEWFDKKLNTKYQSINNYLEQTNEDDIVPGLYALKSILSNKKQNVLDSNDLASSQSGLQEVVQAIKQCYNNSLFPKYNTKNNLAYILLNDNETDFKNNFLESKNKRDIVNSVWHCNKVLFNYLNAILAANTRDIVLYNQDNKITQQMIDILSISFSDKETEKSLLVVSDEIDNTRLINLLNNSDSNMQTDEILKFMAKTGYKTFQILFTMLNLYLSLSQKNKEKILQLNQVKTDLDNVDDETLLNHYRQMQK